MNEFVLVDGPVGVVGASVMVSMKPSFHARRVANQVKSDLKNIQRLHSEYLGDADKDGNPRYSMMTDEQIEGYRNEFAHCLENGYMNSIVYGFVHNMGDWLWCVKYEVFRPEYGEDWNEDASGISVEDGKCLEGLADMKSMDLVFLTYMQDSSKGALRREGKPHVLRQELDTIGAPVRFTCESRDLHGSVNCATDNNRVIGLPYPEKTTRRVYSSGAFAVRRVVSTIAEVN